MLVEMAFPLDLIASVIGHEAGGRETKTLVKHYVRTDMVERKVQVLTAWDRRLNEIIGNETESNIVPMLLTA